MKYINDYISSLNVNEDSEKSYKSILKAFNDFINDKRSNNRFIPTMEIYESFIFSLKNSGYKTRSINKYISVINNYCVYLYDNGYIKNKIVMEIDKISKSKPKSFITEDQFRRILSWGKENDRFWQRNLLIFAMLYETELKLNEILSLKSHNISRDLNFIEYGSKSISVSTKLKSFLKEIEMNEGFLFKNYKGNPLSRQSVWKVSKKYDEAFEFEISTDILNHSQKVNKLLNRYV